MSAKNRGLSLVLLLLACIGVVLLLSWLLVWNKPDSAIKPLEPDAMHQPSTN